MSKNKNSITTAQIAFASSLIAILCTYALSTSSIQLAVGFWTLFSGAAIFSGSAIILGLVSLLGRRKQRNIIDKVLAIFSIVVPVIMLIFVFLLPRVHADHDPAPRLVCGTNLRGLGVAMHIYSQEYKDKKYPTPDNWCDLLVKYADVDEKMFICKMAKKSGNAKRSHYAINPNCEPDSPLDIILLFETKGGWNQFGGAELLTTENHEGKGCNILFNDKRVRFVRKEKLSELKWK